MIEQIIKIALDAGDIIMDYYEQDYKIDYKDEKNTDPVTSADYKADRFIRKRLSQAFPEDKILSEEAEANNPKDFNGRVWMVDPLDGTKNFVRGQEGFCVMIGLCIDGEPVLGLVYAPASKELYYAEKGKGAWLKKADEKPARISASHVASLADAVKTSAGESPIPRAELKNLRTKKTIKKGSTGLKLCMVACGKADVFVCPYLTTSKWDVCAGQAIVEEAGGMISFLDGKPLDYKQESDEWGRPFLASNSKLHQEAVGFFSQSRK